MVTDHLDILKKVDMERVKVLIIISIYVWNYLTIFFINIFVEHFLLLATSSDFTFLQNHKTIHTEITVSC